MIETFLENKETNVKWVDILAPTAEELRAIASDYHLHRAFVADALQPEHLPKHEPVANTSFFIVRYYAPGNNANADTVQGLTNKIAIFQTDQILLTIHLFEITFFKDIRKELTEAETGPSTHNILNRVFKAVLQTFDAPALELAQGIDRYEEKVFLKKDGKISLSGAYHLKRKIEGCKRIIILSRDIVERIDDPTHQDPDTRDTRDLYIRLLTLYESMAENINQLLTVYFSMSAQRTNEVIRVLTLFSVFFMPLTFIVGIYGMNFQFMPEIEWRLGYPAVLVLMAAVSITIYFWFKRKGWL
jgi:magnesium transporter